MFWLRGVWIPATASDGKPRVDAMLLVWSVARNMYIPDGVDNPLCVACMDLEEVPQPDARTRLYDVLQEILPGLPERVAWHIAEFTHEWHEP